MSRLPPCCRTRLRPYALQPVYTSAAGGETGTEFVCLPQFLSKNLSSLAHRFLMKTEHCGRTVLIVLDVGEEPLFCVLMRLAAVNQG